MSNLVSSDRSGGQRPSHDRPAEATSLPKCHEPLLRFIDHLAEAGRPAFGHRAGAA